MPLAAVEIAWKLLLGELLLWAAKLSPFPVHEIGILVNSTK
jgi:hypothetical protein